MRLVLPCLTSLSKLIIAPLFLSPDLIRFRFFPCIYIDKADWLTAPMTSVTPQTDNSTDRQPTTALTATPLLFPSTPCQVHSCTPMVFPACTFVEIYVFTAAARIPSLNVSSTDTLNNVNLHCIISIDSTRGVTVIQIFEFDNSTRRKTTVTRPENFDKVSLGFPLIGEWP